MSADKRSVHTDALATLGTIITEGGRDAIHLAVEPIIAAEKLFPGQDVGIVDGKASTKAEKKLGIVDPFLKEPVFEGSMFWLVVYPRQITSLRHVWEHPDFTGAKKAETSPWMPEGKILPGAHLTSKEYSEAWLIDWCKNNDCPEWPVVKAALLGEHVDNEDYGGDAYCDEGEYLLFRGRDAHASIPLDFWEHFERAVGKPLKRYDHFSCSC